MRFRCKRCGRVTSDAPYYVTPELQVLCFGCLCEANPTIALEVIHTAMKEERERERQEREDDKEFCKYYSGGQCTENHSGGYICVDCGNAN